MPRNDKPESSTIHNNGDSSFVSLLAGWMQQGVENVFATQRILVDLAMSQNANAMSMIRGRFADPNFRPAEVATELAGEAIANFIEGQKLLLGLAQREYEIVTMGVKERVAGYTAAVAITDLAQRGFDTYVTMQQEFLKIASRQTHTWLSAVKSGKGFEADGLVEAAREAVEIFVRTQKKFLDVVTEETLKATGGKETGRRVRTTELSHLAAEATDALMEAQKKLIDVAGRQVNANVRAAERTAKMITPFPFMPIPDLTREGVKNFVSAEKALIDTVMHPAETKHAAKPRRKRAARPLKVKAASA